MSEPTKNPSLADQPSPPAGQPASDPSMTATAPPPELSSIEVASSPGTLTPANLRRVSFPRARSQDRIASYLDSMTAMLPPNQAMDTTTDDATHDQKLEAIQGTQPSVAGPGSVRRSSFASPFVSSVPQFILSPALPSQNEMDVSPTLPALASSHGKQFEHSHADVSTAMSKVFNDFQTRFRLRGHSPAPGLQTQAHAGSLSHPTFEVGTGFSSSASDVPSARVPLEQFLRPLQTGDMPRPRPNLAGVPRSFINKDAEQVLLKSVNVSKLSDADVLFFFGTFCSKARLSPEFMFKYGGTNGKQIGVRLMMYGATVLLPADSATVDEARVKASRQALLELQKNNPQWHIPPLPFSGSNDPKWSWTELVVAFCNEVGWPRPMSQAYEMNGLWHAELGVVGHFYRTYKGCDSKNEALELVSHHALHGLLTASDVEVGRVLPAGSPLLSLPEAKGAVSSEGGGEDKRFDTVLSSIAQLRAGPGAKQETKPTGKVSGLVGGKIGKNPAKPTAPKASNSPKKAANAKKPADAPPPPPKSAPPKAPTPKPAGPSARRRHSRNGKKDKRKSAGPPAPQPPAKGKGVTKQVGDPEGQEAPPANANKVRVERSRLGGPAQNRPAQLFRAPAEDPLVTLKGVQDSILGLSPRASFRRIMRTMCMALKVPEPTFSFPPAPTNASGHTHLAQAKWGDDCPWLRRASPVDLGTLTWVDQNSAESYGEKRVILFLLKTCRGEVPEEVLEESWERELRGLSHLEEEVKSSLRSMGKPSGH